MLPNSSDLVFIGFGGNLAESLQAFRQARQKLSDVFTSLISASLYSSSPQLDTQQPDFLNTVVGGYFNGSPLSLLNLLQDVEREAGRIRDPFRPKGPRILDLDILLWGSLIMTSDRLVVPHPALVDRRFVLEPLLELAPDWVDPRTGLALEDYRLNVLSQGVYRLDKNW